MVKLSYHSKSHTEGEARCKLYFEITAYIYRVDQKISH